MSISVSQTFLSPVPGRRIEATGVFVTKERDASLDEMSLAEYAAYHKRVYGDDSLDTGSSDTDSSDTDSSDTGSSDDGDMHRVTLVDGSKVSA